MRRKVIQIADSTQLISLPRKWALKQNIKKGDELEVTEKNHELVISCQSTPKIETVELSLSDYGPISIRLIHALYKRGIDEVKINIQSPTDVQLIQTVLQNETVGYEIIEQNKTFCTIKNVSGYIEGFDSLLRRTFLLLISMAEEGVRAVKEKSPSELKNAELLEKSNNRFTTVCRRYINRNRDTKYDKIGPLYYIIEDVENIADEFKYLYQALGNIKQNELKISPEVMKCFEELVPLIRSFYNAFYKNDPKEIIEVRDRRKNLVGRWYELLPKLKTTPDKLIMHHAVVIVQKVFNLVGPYLVLQSKSDQ